MIGQYTHITLTTGHSVINNGRNIDPKVLDHIWPAVSAADFGGEAELAKGMMLKRLMVGFGGDRVRYWQLRYKDHKDPCVQMILCADVDYAKQCWQKIKQYSMYPPGIKMPRGCFLAVSINPISISSLPDGMINMLADMEQCIAWAWLKSKESNDGKFQLA